MSEVLIRMKMPKCCEECRFFAWKRGVGQHCAVDDRITFHATLDGFDVGYERNGDCPLVPVPPHGDLIDRDGIKWIEKEFEERCHNDRWTSVEEIAYKAQVDKLPTIIPAEEK